MSVESQLAEMEELESRMAQVHEADRLDAMYQEQDDKMEAFIESLDGLTQDQFVRFMDLTREMSWDIPSALMAICSHGGDGEDGLYFYMHRMKTDEEAARFSFIGHGPSEWATVDEHFKEVHGLDLKDERINWSFDT